MKLFLIYQTVNGGYDTYDSAVVAAETEEVARNISPAGGYHDFTEKYSSWAYKLKEVQSQYLGEAAEGTEQGVICASFNAG